MTASCNTEHMRALIEALESGEYEQGRELLRPASGGWCCLGVACELARLDGIGQWVTQNLAGHGEVISFEAGGSSAHSMPHAVQEWLGVADAKYAGLLPIATRRSGTTEVASAWNDGSVTSDIPRHDFSEIAAGLRAYYGIERTQEL